MTAPATRWPLWVTLYALFWVLLGAGVGWFLTREWQPVVLFTGLAAGSILLGRGLRYWWDGRGR